MQHKPLGINPNQDSRLWQLCKKITNPIDWNTACNDILSTWIVNFHILNYFSTLKRQMLLKFTFNMFKESKTFWTRMTSQFHVCWWPCDVSSQDIIRYDIDLAPVSLMIFRSNSKLDQNLKCSGLKYTLLIRTKFCTHHGSGTVLWRVQTFSVISWACFKLQHSKFWLNFAFYWNTVNGTEA